VNLLWILVLALAWTALVGELNPFRLAEGAVLGFLVLLLRRQIGLDFLVRIWKLGVLLVYFVWKLFLANLRVALDIVTPNDNIRAGVVAVPLDIKGSMGVTALANIISLTPGTVTMDVSDDQSVIYIHTMHLRDLEEFRRDVKQGFERRLMEVLN
jgi:multicomponent Na+:H+ antiporter subunit E